MGESPVKSLSFVLWKSLSEHGRATFRLFCKMSAPPQDFLATIVLARKPFTKQVRLHLPRKRSGHEGVQDAVQPAWNDAGAVFEQTPEALRYALIDAHRFQRHGLRIEAELFEHRCVRKPGCLYSAVATERFEL